MRVGWTKELRGSWRWTAERRAAELATGPGREQLALDSRELAWNHGQGQSTLDSGDSRGDKMGSSEEDRLKMSAFEVLVEFSLVTHASDSPHMHIVLQYLFSALG